MIEKRQNRRTRMVLPLRVWVDDSQEVQFAHTIDISESGAKLRGLHKELTKGEIVLVQRGRCKARFRVIWSRILSTNEIEAGLQFVELNNGTNFWGIELDREGAESPEDFLKKLLRTTR